MDKLWCMCCDDCGANGSCYNGPTLYTTNPAFALLIYGIADAESMMIHYNIVLVQNDLVYAETANWGYKHITSSKLHIHNLL